MPPKIIPLKNRKQRLASHSKSRSSLSCRSGRKVIPFPVAYSLPEEGLFCPGPVGSEVLAPYYITPEDENDLH